MESPGYISVLFLRLQRVTICVYMTENVKLGKSCCYKWRVLGEAISATSLTDFQELNPITIVVKQVENEKDIAMSTRLLKNYA